jgi:hypothetical protein
MEQTHEREDRSGLPAAFLWRHLMPDEVKKVGIIFGDALCSDNNDD